jgi:hypothetical protein
MNSFLLVRVLLVISIYKLCRGCAMQFGGSGSTNVRNCGFCIAIKHRATYRLLCSNSCHHPATVFSGFRFEWLLADPYLENCPQGDKVRSRGGRQTERDCRTPEYPKTSLLPLLPTMAGSMEQVCVFARDLLWRLLSKGCHMTYQYNAIQCNAIQPGIIKVKHGNTSELQPLTYWSSEREPSETNWESSQTNLLRK